MWPSLIMLALLHPRFLCLSSGGPHLSSRGAKLILKARTPNCGPWGSEPWGITNIGLCFFMCIDTKAKQQNPGPNKIKGSSTGGDDSKPFVMEVFNVTHLLNNIKLVKKRSFDAALFSEHSLPHGRTQDVKDALGKGYKTDLSRLDKEKSSNTGGTGCIIRAHSKHIIKPHPQVQDLADILDEGRVGLYAFNICEDVHVLVYIIYNWTGAERMMKLQLDLTIFYYLSIMTR